MTLESTNELLARLTLMGDGYNSNGAKPILAAVQREPGLEAVNQLISVLEPERILGFKPGTVFKN